jgi:hypothetical protein
MYLISVTIGRAQPLVWALAFNDEKKALAALEALRSVGDIDVADEHGQRLIARGGDIGPIMFENQAESKIATIERALNDQRIRSAVVSRMQADPAMRAAMPGHGGPAILQPMNGMRG